LANYRIASPINEGRKLPEKHGKVCRSWKYGAERNTTQGRNDAVGEDLRVAGRVHTAGSVHLSGNGQYNGPQFRSRGEPLSLRRGEGRLRWKGRRWLVHGGRQIAEFVLR
jgi:hypothetical protein